MFQLAIVCLVVTFIAAFLGFVGITSAFVWAAKIRTQPNDPRANLNYYIGRKS